MQSMGVWARSGGRRPLDSGRAGGWPEPFEQHGSGQTPGREVFNQRFWEVTSALADLLGSGVPVWDRLVDYRRPAGGTVFVMFGGWLWFAVADSGPGLGGAVEPVVGETGVWRRW